MLFLPLAFVPDLWDNDWHRNCVNEMGFSVSFANSANFIAC